MSKVVKKMQEDLQYHLTMVKIDFRSLFAGLKKCDELADLLGDKRVSQAKIDFVAKLIPNGYQIISDKAISWLFQNHPDVYEEFYKRLGNPTTLALDAANVCRVIEHIYIDGTCAECGSPEPPRK